MPSRPSTRAGRVKKKKKIRQKEEEGKEDTKYQFPDTQIKIDLSGPK